MPTIKRILVCQLIIAVILTTIVGLMLGRNAAWSAMIGGCLVIVPAIVYGLFLSRVDPRYPRKIVRSLYLGEALKIILTGFLLIVVLHFYNARLGPLLVGLLGVYSVYFFAGCFIQ